MHIDRGASLGGVPALAVRDFLRRYAGPGFMWDERRLAHALKLTSDAQRARGVLDELIRLGYVVPKDGGGERLWAVAPAAARFMCARGGARLPREAADNLLMKLVTRCALANGTRPFAHWIVRLSVFGSYLTDAPLLGDLDVVLETEPKDAIVEKQMARESARWCAARDAGRRVSEDNLYGWSEDEIRRFLRDRSRHLQIVSPEDIGRLGIEARPVFERASSPS